MLKEEYEKRENLYNNNPFFFHYFTVSIFEFIDLLLQKKNKEEKKFSSSCLKIILSQSFLVRKNLLFRLALIKYLNYMKRTWSVYLHSALKVNLY